MKPLNLGSLIILAVSLNIGYVWADTIFSDNMTNFPSGWALSGTSGQHWTRSSVRYKSASYSAKCTPRSNYSNSVDVYMEKDVSLSGYDSATLTFYI